MRTFAKKSKAPQQVTSTKPTIIGRTHHGQSLEVSSILHLQRTIGNQAVQRSLEADPEDAKGDSTTIEGVRFGHDFSQVRVRAMGETARYGTSGSGGSLPYMEKIQRSFGHHDVSHVRAHQGSRAAEAARAIGARAYTYGDRVAFGDLPDLRTAAHEAAHVVQQRAGVQLAGGVGQAGDVYERHADAVAERVVGGQSAEALLDRMAPARSRALGVQRRVVQRTPITTNYGTFDTTRYKKLGPAGSEYGVDIEITFDPDRTKVDAKKIGLTQTVRVNLGGTNTGWYPVERRRMVASGAGEGSQIDTLSSGAFGNPLYVAGSPSAKDKLGDTPTVASWGQHGWNYRDKSGLHHQIAKFNDSPSAAGRGNNSSQTFETVALGVEGTQSGTYMGSVSWGWRVDGAGKFTKLPFSLVSKGTPSAGFFAAAKQWNAIANFGNIKTKANPTNVYNAAYSVAFTVAKDTAVRVTGNAFVHANLVYDQITILSGKNTGKTGLIKMNDMQDTGGTAAVLKLPVEDVREIGQGVRLYSNPIDTMIKLVPGTPIPRGTSVRVLGHWNELVDQVEVVTGPLAGQRGYISSLGSYR